MYTMNVVHSLLLCALLIIQTGDALRCFSCVGSNDEECNQQGSQQCPNYSDACAVIRGQANGVMKSCSFRSFCEQARREGSKAPSVKVQCCYSDDCNMRSKASSSLLNVNYLVILIPVLLSNLLF
ncbi:lymphocyte antigen 6 family member pge [Erpetoichthys calabaricus]|uniref:lymphocyte antigen 6 family member pge n=1 Tax=Erpetoichthys calabaricus TaxID=27687 RepID=UPI00109FF949|nr:lymphocyte antigen 6 family member pge [Erpetoichthys calabaricus]